MRIYISGSRSFSGCLDRETIGKDMYEGRGFTTVTIAAVVIADLAVYGYCKTHAERQPDRAVVTTPNPGQGQISGREPVKQQRGAGFPKNLLPTLHIGPSWTINGDAVEQSGGQAGPSAQVPLNFIGRWTGKVMQTGSAKDEYEVDVAITSGRGSVRVGTANYITVSWMGSVKNTAALCSADLFFFRQ
jgi:hypothetical protein